MCGLCEKQIIFKDNQKQYILEVTVNLAFFEQFCVNAVLFENRSKLIVTF